MWGVLSRGDKQVESPVASPCDKGVDVYCVSLVHTVTAAQTSLDAAQGKEGCSGTGIVVNKRTQQAVMVMQNCPHVEHYCQPSND